MMKVYQQDSQSFFEKIKAVLEPLCQAQAIELVNAELLADPAGPIVRISIDKPGGVTIDDCVRLNRQMGDLMDVHFEQMAAYRLEVSSPGPHRPLNKRADFEKFSGNRIKVELKQPVDGRRRFTGLLKGVAEDRVCVDVDQNTLQIPLDQIGRARLAGSHGE